MALLKRQAWVTAVLSENDVAKALVLAQSLRRSLTSRSTAVIVSPKISLRLRDLLNNEFDSTHVLEEDRNLSGLKAEEFVKLYALTLRVFDKGVFLSPNTLVLRNCDHVFETFHALSFTENMDTSVFGFQPSMNLFHSLTEGLFTMNGNRGSLERYLKKWLENQHKEVIYLDQSYNMIISIRPGDMMMGNAKEASIANFVDDPLVHLSTLAEGNLKSMGLLDRMAVNYWKELYHGYVKPKVDSTTPANLSSGLQPCVTHKYKKEPIAIIGMSCRYPGSNNLDEFWNLILNGVDAVKTPPDFRWTKDQASRNRPDCRRTKAGFLSTKIDEFDAKFFGISPKEVVFMDPQHRLLQELVWEGLEDAAIDATKLRGSNTGVFMGSWTNDFKDILIHADACKEFYRCYMGNSIGAAAARISFLLGLTGPSIATESGCSSAMVAVHLACRSLLLGETNLALACGVNLLLHPFDKDEMPMVISPTGSCKTFDEKADGFARAEGCGVLVLKRLSDAVRDNDRIWALIRGSGMSQEGISKSMGTPTVHCEALAMEQALHDAEVDPSQISYVEAHGTGTIVGDPLEVSAIAKAYGSNRKDELLIGSVKTNVGHTESCSGITGIMKVVLAMQQEIIPPHRNFETLNPAINLDIIPAKIPLEPVPWPKSNERVRLAGVSSFGITGTDAHAIIEEPPTFVKPKSSQLSGMERPLHILKISAKSEEALEELFRSYQDHLKSMDEKQFPDFLHTANSGRADFGQRATLLARNKDEAIDLLSKRKVTRGEITEMDKKICFLFTGQGSQYIGMAKVLYDTSPVFRLHFEFCEMFLKKVYSINVREALWPEVKNGKTEIARTIYSQTSIFCVEYALMKLWESWGVKPDYVLGHSLGEFAAAVCAQILSVEDALKLVAERSLLIDDLPGGKMLVIKADKMSVDSLMKKFSGMNKSKLLDYAAVNSIEQTVVAGDSQVVQDFSQYCKDRNVKTIVLEATHAFHSKHMEPMLDEYYRVATTVKQIDATDGSPLYISGLFGKIVEKERIDANYWVQHTRDKVEFLNASKAAVEQGCQVFIEVGPQPVLSALTMMNNDKVQITCLPSLKKNDSEWGVILGSVSKLYITGKDIDWKGLDQFYDRKKVRIPHYPFQGKRHWPDMMAATGNAIHPLLGASIPNASSTKIFQHTLSTTSLEFAKDHAIGSNVIFPGAGYLEMCVAAGHAAVEGSVDTWTKPSRPMKVENLTIEAPLRLYDSKACQIQVVIDFKDTEATDWNDINIKIFHRLESETETVKWLPHASATFSPLPTAQEKLIDVDTERLLSIRNNESDDALIKEVYEKLASLGLKFGPMFQSLEKVWKMDGESQNCLLAQVKLPSEDQHFQQYIIHPVILDAMIQAIMLKNHKDKIKRKLYVPITIGKFIWLSSIDTDDICFIYVFEQKSLQKGNRDSTSALLMNQDGKLLGLMCQVEFIDTTVKAVDSVLEQQTCTMPDIWEESWRPELGPMQHRIADKILKDVNPFERNDFAHYNETTEDMNSTYDKFEKFIYLWIVNALHELKWTPEKSTKFNSESLASEIGVTKAHCLLLNYFLEVLEIEGILTRLNPSGDWEIARLPISQEKVKLALSSPQYEDLTKKFDSANLIARIGENLPKILTGQQSGLTVLFPEQKNLPTPSHFYEDYGDYFRLTLMVKDVFQSRMQKWNEIMKSNEASSSKYIFRILEVGAGTGIFSAQVLEALTEENVEFEYMYTDISPAFFGPAAKKFEKHVKRMKFKKLNIEEDPTVQGFTPGYYDLVIASDVIHATQDVIVTLENMKKLLREGGNIDIMEQIMKNRPISFIFGILDGFWRFKDELRLKDKHCILSDEKWRYALNKAGFDKIQIFPGFKNRHGYITARATDHRVPEGQNLTMPTWIIFRNEKSKLCDYLTSKLIIHQRNFVEVMANDDELILNGEHLKASCTTKEGMKRLFEEIQKSIKGATIEGVAYLWGLDRSRQNQSGMLQPFLYLTHEVIHSLRQRFAPRMCVISEGIAPIGNSDLSHVHPSTLWGFVKVLKNEHSDINCRCIAIQSEDELSEKDLQEVFYELWAEDRETQIAFLDNIRHVPRLQPVKPNLQDLSLPTGTDRFQLILPETKSINDLKFGPLEDFTLASDEIEVQVKVSALNFRDLFSVMKPIEEFKNVNTVGLDFAGFVKRVGGGVSKWKIGDYVFGANLNGGPLPSHIQVPQNQVIKVPERMTLCEAATLPAVFATSYICLVDVAKIKASDTILIHAASGGVGLSAVEIAQHFGATIIATAGSKRKQNYLKSLGIKHIFHSRNTKYADEILKVTNGRGVDIVLNSLTSEGFKEATLRACAKGARFVEMSKLSVWKPEEVRELRPDIEYTIVDVSKADGKEMERVYKKLETSMDRAIVNPIAYTRFDCVNIREAMRYLQGAKQIGKVVVVFPELRIDQGEVKTFTPQFNDRSTYLVTGGLGGIGFEVANWMVDRGAKTILLAGRSQPSSSMQEKINEKNTKCGSNLISVQLDVGDYDQCKILLKEKLHQMNLPPLRGIMHAAGTLADGLIVNHTDWAKFSSTFNSKINGTLNLHKLTQDCHLEHFVLFSSITSLFGSPGQANHASGNNFEDTFAHYRHSVGLPATTVNWGQWAQVGIATEIDLPGMKALSTVQGLTALEYALRAQRVQTAVMNVDSFVLASKFYSQIAVYLDEKVWKSRGASGTTLVVRSDEFWQEYDTKSTRDEKLCVVTDRLKGVLRFILKLDDDEPIDDHTNFQEMGVDSLMFVEIKNALQNLLGDRVTVTASALRDCNNVDLLSNELVKLIEGEDAESDSIKPTAEEVMALLREDCILSETITPVGIKPCCKIGSVQNVLLTGATGTLGPYVLLELSKRPDIKKIYCLLRNSSRNSQVSIKERLLKHLSVLKLTLDTSKMEYIEGDVSKDRLGIDDEAVWNSLTKNIDAVFHCAIRADHTQYYRKRSVENDRDVRSVNIRGLKNVLEFACNTKLKHIFHASSLLSVSTTDEEGRLSESWPNFEDYDKITSMAYPISKFVCEILLKKATENGVPCKVFRFPLIGGHSKTGRSNAIHHNHLMLRYFYIMKSGMMPSNPFPLALIPVDTCAQVSLKLFFDERAPPSDIYNITHDKPELDQEFPTIAEELGFSVNIVEFDEFVKKMESEPDDSVYAMFKQLYKNNDELMATYTSAKAARIWFEGRENFWISKKLTELQPDYYGSLQSSMECLRRDMLFAKSEGYFEKYDLRC